MWLGDVPRPGTRDGRPLLYLDVDGVLSPDTPNEGFTEHAIGRLTVRISAEHGIWLRNLSTSYDLVWATTWEEHANEHIGPLLGLPPLPHVDFFDYTPRRGDPRIPVMQLPYTRKWAPILRHANGRPFAWADDVLPLTIRRQAFPHRRHLRLLPVNPARGLTFDQVRALHRWAARLERRG